MVAALVDRGGIIRQTRRVGAPVSFDTSSTSIRLYMTGNSANAFVSHVNASLSYNHCSNMKGLFFNGQQSTQQTYGFYPYSKRLMAVICYRIF